MRVRGALPLPACTSGAAAGGITRRDVSRVRRILASAQLLRSGIAQRDELRLKLRSRCAVFLDADVQSHLCFTGGAQG